MSVLVGLTSIPSPCAAMARTRAAAATSAAATALPAGAITAQHVNSPSQGDDGLRRVAGHEVPLERLEADVEVREVLPPTLNLGPLLGDEITKIVRHPLEVTRRAEDGQLAGAVKGQVERPQPHEQPKPLHVGRGVVTISAGRPRRHRQQAGGFVEANGLRGRASFPGEFADAHGPHPRPSSYWNVKWSRRFLPEVNEPELCNHRAWGRLRGQSRGTNRGVAAAYSSYAAPNAARTSRSSAVASRA